MNDVRESKRFTFSIRTLLIITALVAVHVGVPVLGKALLATLVAALVLNFVSATPLAALIAIYYLVTGKKPDPSRKPTEMVGMVYVTILVLVSP